MTHLSYQFRCFFVTCLTALLLLSCHSSLKVHYLYPSNPTKTIKWFNYCLNNITNLSTFQKARDVLSGPLLEELYAIESLIVHNLSNIKKSRSSSSKKSSIAIYTPKTTTASERQKVKFSYFKDDIKLLIQRAKNLKIQILKIRPAPENLKENTQKLKKILVSAYFYYESGLKPESKQLELVYKNSIWKIQSIQSISDSMPTSSTS